MVAFQTLLGVPEVAELKDNAISIAKHERWAWYPIWLKDSTILQQAVKVAAEQLGLPRHEVFSTAAEGLLGVYYAAKGRVVHGAGLLPAARRPLKVRKR